MLLNTMVEMGILGAVALAGFAVLILKQSYQRSKLLFALFIAFFASSLVEVESFNSLVVFVMLMGFLGTDKDDRIEVPGLPIYPSHAISAAILIILAVLSILFYPISFLGLHLMNRTSIMGIERQWNLGSFLPSFQRGYEIARFSPFFQAVGTKDAVDSFLLIGYEKADIEVRLDLLQTLTNNLEKALLWFPNDLRLIYSLGKLYAEWGSADFRYYAKAESLFRRGYAMNPKKQVFLIALGELTLRRAGKDTHDLQLKKGLDYFYDAIAAEDKAPVPHWLLGKAMMLYGLKDGAAREFITAVDLGIIFQRASEPLSAMDLLGEKKAYPQIQMLYEQIIRLQPRVGLHHARLATTYLLNGDKENARKEAEKAIELDPGLKQGYEEMMKALGRT
jgi:tetratricopeptide (TPR) repeat protein